MSHIRRCHGFHAFRTQLECVYLILPCMRSNNQWCLRNNIKAKSYSYQWICTYNHHVYKHSQWKPMTSREYWHFPLIHTRDIKNVLSHCHLVLKFALYIELYGYWLTDVSLAHASTFSKQSKWKQPFYSMCKCLCVRQITLEMQESESPVTYVIKYV